MVEEKEIYQLISETMHDGLLELDLHGKIIRANPAALSMLGYTREELLQKTHRELTPAKWRQQESQIIQESTLAQQNVANIEQEYWRKNGSVFSVALTPILLADAGKKPTKILILFRDLTSPKEQEQLQQAHLRQLNSLSLITRKLQENDTIEHTIHFVLEALVAAMTHPHLAVPLVAIEDETFSTNKYSDDLEYGLTSPLFVNGNEAGEVTMYYSENKPFKLPDEQNILDTVANALGIWLSLKSANQELADFEEQYRAIFDTMSDGFALYEVKNEGRDIVVADWNRAAEKMYNLLRQEALGQDIKKFFPAMEKTDVYKAIVECARSGEMKIIPLLHYQDPEHDQYMHNIIYQVGDKVAAIFRDVTEEEKVRQELVGSEQKYRSLIEGSAEAIYLHTMDPVNPQFVDINQSACQMLHYTRAELLAMGPTKIDSPENAALAPGRIAKVLKEGKALFESEHITKEGQRLPVEVNGSVVEISGQKYMLSFVRDITERKTGEAALQRSEAQLSNAVSIARLGPWEYDVVNDIFTFTDSFYAIFHTTAEKVGGYTMPSAEYAKRFVHPEDVPLVGIETRKAIEATDPGFSHQLEHRMIDANGDIGYISVRFFIIKDKQGQTIRTYGVNQDITERKKAEVALSKQQQELSTILDSSPAMIFYKDKDNKFVRVNQAMAKSMGLTKEQLEGKSLYELYPQEEAEKYWQDDKAVMDSGQSKLNIVEPMQTKEGMKWVQTEKIPYKNDKDEIIGVVGFAMDITAGKQTEELLKQSEIQYRTLVNNLPGAVYRCVNDADWTMYFISDTIEALSGYPAADFIDNKKRSYNSIIYPDDRTPVFELIQQKIRKKDPYNIEYRLLHQDGTLRWVTEKGQGIYDDQGALLWLDGAIFDITERKTQEQKYKAIIETSIDGFWMTDLQGNIIEINDSYCKMIGYSRAELLKMKIADVEVMEDAEAVQPRIQKIKENGSDRFETRHKRKDGTIIDIWISVTYLRDTDRMFVFASDITERKRAEEALRVSEYSYRLLAENATDVIWTVDLQMNPTYISPSITRMVGYGVEEAMKRSMAEAFSPRSYGLAMTIFREELTREKAGVKDASRSRVVEIELNHKNGSIVIAEVIFSFLRGPAGQPKGILAMARDITERTRMNAELQKRMNELDRFNKVTMEREKRIIELKKKLKDLEQRADGQQ